jgi:hypothetical protein
MKSILKLNEIRTLSLGVDIAEFNLTLTNEVTKKKLNFTLETTGMSLVLKNDIKHSTHDLRTLIEWLDLPSKNKKNLRDNSSEIILHGKELLKMNDKINKEIII